MKQARLVGWSGTGVSVALMDIFLFVANRQLVLKLKIVVFLSMVATVLERVAYSLDAHGLVSRGRTL